MILGKAIDDLGGLGDTPPVASFGFTTTGLVAHFTDTSKDSDGKIASRAWRLRRWLGVVRGQSEPPLCGGRSP